MSLTGSDSYPQVSSATPNIPALTTRHMTKRPKTMTARSMRKRILLRINFSAKQSRTGKLVGRIYTRNPINQSNVITSKRQALQRAVTEGRNRYFSQKFFILIATSILAQCSSSSLCRLLLPSSQETKQDTVPVCDSKVFMMRPLISPDLCLTMLPVGNFILPPNTLTTISVRTNRQLNKGQTFLRRDVQSQVAESGDKV